MFEIVGREEQVFEQWEQGKKVINPCMKAGDEVVFRNSSGATAVMIAREESGQVVCDVPNKLLQMALNILVDLEQGSDQHSDCQTVFAVNPADKPADYVYIDNTIREEVKPSGGGGVYVPSDWNAAEGEPGHILNRPFYEESAVLLQNAEIAFTESGEGAVAQEIGFELGGHYEVTWNGTAYSCTAVEFDLGGVPVVGVGDEGFVSSGEPSGSHPFIIFDLPSAAAAEIGFPAMATALDGSSSAVVSISGEVIHPIDTKYLPEMSNNNHFVEIDLQINSDMTITVAKSSMTFSDITSLADEDKPTVAIARVDSVPGSTFYFYLHGCGGGTIDFFRFAFDGDALNCEKIQAMNGGTWSYTKERYIMNAAP